MKTRSIVIAVLMLSASRVLASDASVDQREPASPAQPCTCACVHPREANAPDSRAQPQVDFGETANWPAY